jgi:cytochrome c-type biogenesis protein CcmH/NrfG
VTDERLNDLDDAHRAAALKLREVLRASEHVDPLTASRLARARARAVAESGSGSSPRWIWASGGLTAAAVVAAVLLMQFGGWQRWRADPAGTNVADAIEVLTHDVDADFYEDLDMYRWLAEDGRA